MMDQVYDQPDALANQSYADSQCIDDAEQEVVCINGIDYALFTGEPSFLKEGEAQLAPAIATYCLSFIAGLIGNLMIVCAVLQTDVRRSATNIYLLSLAISDAVFLLVCVPYKLATDFVNGWGLGNSFCKIFAYVELVATVAAIYNLVAVSFERYIAISHPMKARYVVTIGNSKRLITVICIFSFITGIPLLHSTKVDSMRYFINKTQEQYTAHLCNQPDLSKAELLYFAIYRMMLMLAVPGVLMSFCYSRVILALRRSTKIIDPAQIHSQSRKTRTNTVDQRNAAISMKNTGSTAPATGNVRVKRRTSLCIHESRQQVIKMLIVIVLVFILSWSPKLTFELLENAGVHMFTNEALWIKTLSDLLPYLQCCINPYIYCFMSANFRHYIKRIVNSAMRLCCSKYMNRSVSFSKLALSARESHVVARKWRSDPRNPARKTEQGVKATGKKGAMEIREETYAMRNINVLNDDHLITPASSCCVEQTEELEMELEAVSPGKTRQLSIIAETKSIGSGNGEIINHDEIKNVNGINHLKSDTRNRFQTEKQLTDNFDAVLNI